MKELQEKYPKILENFDAFMDMINRHGKKC